MKLGSLRLRLLFGAGAFILAALAVAAIAMVTLFERHVERWTDFELNAHLDQVIAGIDAGPSGDLAVTRAPADPRFNRPLSGLYWEVTVDPAGPVLRSRSLWDQEIVLPREETIDDAVHHHQVAGPQGQTLYLLQRRIALPARLGGRTARVAVALNDAEVRSAVRRFATVLAPLLLILGGLLTAAAWVQVTVGLRPLSAMRARLAAIGRGDERRLGARFPDEIQPLVREIDALLDARDRQLEKARAGAADLAHGLKTPLQVLAGDVRRLRAKGDMDIAAEIESVANAMQRHVDRQLARARLAAGNADASADVGAIAARVARVMERTPDGSRLRWLLDVPAGLEMRIDPDDLAEALGNLVENAARHARLGVAIMARAEAKTVVLTVGDDGPGIPSERQDEALGRGNRLDSSGPGEGLGLAIVADIADAWHGSLSIRTGEGGFHVCLSIPSAGDAGARASVQPRLSATI